MRYSDKMIAELLKRQGIEPDFVITKPRRRDNAESRAQQAIISWFDTVSRREFGLEPFLLYSVPNGAKRSPITGAILKREGARSGAPDLLLDVARGGWHGLRLEMKAEDGECSPAQRAFHSALIEQGYKVRIAYSVRSAIDVISGYLKT